MPPTGPLGKSHSQPRGRWEKRERERRVKRTRTGRKTDKSIEGEREWMKNGKGTESEDDGGIKQEKMETCR